MILEYLVVLLLFETNEYASIYILVNSIVSEWNFETRIYASDKMKLEMGDIIFLN